MCKQIFKIMIYSHYRAGFPEAPSRGDFQSVDGGGLHLCGHVHLLVPHLQLHKRLCGSYGPVCASVLSEDPPTRDALLCNRPAITGHVTTDYQRGGTHTFLEE